MDTRKLVMGVATAALLLPAAASAQYSLAPSGEERQQEDGRAITQDGKPMTDEERKREAEREAGPLKPVLNQPDAQDPGENRDPEHDGHPGQTQGRE